MANSFELIKKIVTRKVLFHSLFWLVILLIVFEHENWNNQSSIRLGFFLQYILAFIIFIVVSYSNIYFLIPRYFKKKRYVLYGTLLLVFVVIGTLITVSIKNVTELLGCQLSNYNKFHDESNLYYFFHILFGQSMFIIATTFLYVMDEWIRLQGVNIQMQEIESEKVRSELQALKAQINPHFLFNTLNNIYSHSLEKSDKTPEMILKLSDLMSYILYECHDERVPISNEINFIKNYIDLEKLRYEDQLMVDFNIEEQDNSQTIVPLLLIPFIENAFKHVGSTLKQKPYVKVIITVNSNQIQLKLINSVNTGVTKKETKSGGIGIENVRKRLELLYPKRYNLSITNTENEFCVELKLTNHAN
jgi:two-component system LytT family sensor kinase